MEQEFNNDNNKRDNKIKLLFKNLPNNNNIFLYSILSYILDI